MILKIINLLTSNLTKNLLIFMSLILTLPIFARDIPPHELKKHYVLLEYNIDYDSVSPPNINAENEINSLALPTISDEDEISLLVSPTINTGNIFSSDSLSSNSSNGEIIFEEEEHQLDYPVFDDYNALLSQGNLLVNNEVESELSSDGYLTPNENIILGSSSNESQNGLLILNPESSISIKLDPDSTK